jgi:hypothetical protein
MAGIGAFVFAVGRAGIGQIVAAAIVDYLD